MNSDFGSHDFSRSVSWDPSVSGGSDQEMDVSFVEVSVNQLASGSELRTQLTDSKGKEQGKAAKVASKVGSFFKKGAGALLLGMASIKGSESLAETGKELKGGKKYQVGDGLRAKASRLEAEANKLDKAGEKLFEAGSKLYYDGKVDSKKEAAGAKMRDKGKQMQTKANELRHEAKTLREDASTKVSEEVKGPSMAKQRMRAAIGKLSRGFGSKLWDIGNKVKDGKFTRSTATSLEISGKNMRRDAKIKVREAKIDQKHKEGLKYINSLQIDKKSKEELKGYLGREVEKQKGDHIQQYHEYLHGKGQDVSKPKLEFDPKVYVDSLVTPSEKAVHLEGGAFRIADKLVASGKLTASEGQKLKDDIKYVMDKFRAKYPNEKPRIDAEDLCKHIKKYDLDDLVEVMAGMKSISVALPKLEDT